MASDEDQRGMASDPIVRPDNTRQSWGEFLFALAEEAAHDAAEHDTSLSLHSLLTDLSLVLAAYAGRCGVERSARPPVEEEELAVAAAPEPSADAPASEQEAAEPESETEPEAPLAEADEAASEPITDDVTLSSHEDERFAQVTVHYVPRESWVSVAQAREQLTGLARVAHNKRAASRQRTLDRVLELSMRPNRDNADDLELQQHQQDAERLRDIDTVLQLKLDEIAAGDDLDALRAYDVEAGWP